MNNELIFGLKLVSFVTFIRLWVLLSHLVLREGCGI